MADILDIANQFTYLTEEAKEIGGEVKETKGKLLEFFEQHSDVDQIGKVKCQRTPKKNPVNAKKVLEIVEEEILKTTSSPGATVIENITSRVKAIEAPSEMQLKISIISEKKPRKKAKTG